jgi:HD-like signal output (HDOD) protein
MKPRVIFVDDDPMLLASTRRQLMMKLPQCELVFFSTADEALADIAMMPPQIVFSDVRMPGIDGPEFLSRVSLSNPETIRFAWTGQSEVQQLERVFKVAHQVLSKPIASEQLVSIIANLVDYRTHISNRSLMASLTGADHNRFDCARIKKVLAIIDNPNTSAEAVATEIDKSSIARARLLGIANSSFFSPVRTVADSKQAVMMIGFGIVRAIFLSSEYKCDNQLPPVQLTLHQCLKRGIEAAIAIQDLAITKGFSDSDRNSAIVAAMFHCFGMVQFAIHGGNTYAELQSRANGNEQLLMEFEQQHFGASRYQVAAYLLCLWGIDPVACRAIFLLGTPNADCTPVASLVQQHVAAMPVNGKSHNPASTPPPDAIR